MTKRHCLFLLPGALLGLLCTGIAAAQGLDEQKRRQSHIPIPSSVGSADEAQAFLAQRLHRAEQVAGLEKLLKDPKFLEMAKEVASDPAKYGLDKEIEKFKKEFDPSKGPPDLNDPAVRKVLDKVLDEKKLGNLSGTNISEDQQKALRDFLDRFQKEPRPGVGPDGTPRPADGSQPSKGESPMPQPPGMPPDSPGPQPADTGERPRLMPPAPPPPDPAQDAQARFTKQIYDLVQRLQKTDPNLAKSPAVADFFKQLGHYTGPGNSRPSRLPDAAKHLGERLPRLADYLNLEVLRRDAENWRPEKPLFPAPHFPAFRGGPPVTLPGAGLPRPPAGHVDVSGWPLLLWALVGLGFGVALWRILAWQQGRTGRAGDAAWKLGPWPVSPAGVTTREDLVRAFDYLALLCLGQTARTWNHLEIAARLGDEAPRAARMAAAAEERRGAAARLALLYEQARYAPPAEPLPDADLAAARRHLCLLAGVPAA
jgi:hypothetical protein